MADPTADLRKQLADHEADKDNETQNVSLTLAIVEDCDRRKCKLTSRPRIQKQIKQEDTKILATIQNFRRRQKGTDQSKHSQHFRALSSTTMWVWLSYNRMWVWFRVHAHKNYTN